MTTYTTFLASKRRHSPESGFDVADSDINPCLFDWQRDIVRWAIRRGKASVFCDTGLGKTIQQLEWASLVYRETGRDILLLAPLAVSRQTFTEAHKFGIVDYCPVNVASEQFAVQPGITITNYQKLHKFDVDHFIGIVLDESSIIKHQISKTRDKIISAFRDTPYRLACTATPAPNDQMELGNHAEFMGVMSRAEMLAMYFTHDGGDTSKWRLKKHAHRDFYRWMATWSVMIRNPADIGYDGSAFILPELRIHQHEVKSKMPCDGFLFVMEAKTLKEQREARRQTISGRVKLLGELTNADPSEPWVVWCNLNAESTAAASVVKGSVEIRGTMLDYKKEEALLDFTDGTKRAVVTKPSIAGFGMNWQHCHNMAFLGIDNSYEKFYQAVRRCWRFGQTEPVDVHVIVSDRDGAIARNLQRKEAEAREMSDGMIEAMAETSRDEIQSARREQTEYDPKVIMQLPEFV